ncbi:MAG: GH12 family glycosyl hydrolase domain-containing protein [Spirochaetota bacterium]
MRQHHIAVSISIIVVIISASCRIQNGTGKNTQDENGVSSAEYSVQRCDEFATIDLGDYILVNNTWGREEIVRYTQCIFRESTVFQYPVGWKWDWPRYRMVAVKAYPGIIFGFKPWSASSTSSALPVRITDMGSIRAVYDIATSANGDYNLALELWLTSDNTPRPENITTEIMIWLDNSGMTPAGDFIDDVTIDSIRYSFYKGYITQTGRWYIALVRRKPELSGETEISGIVRWLAEKRHVSPDDFIASIEIGNEIVSGEGVTTVNSYAVDVK